IVQRNTPMAVTRMKLDLQNPPRLTQAQANQLEAMTRAEIEAGAASDLENPPLSQEELARVKAARRVREVRAHTGLSQPAFAKAYHINVGRLRDLEQGRTQADSAVLAYLTVIDREPEA
ncbi:hypothetical protein LTR94_031101, partial [Friedmanniomyces endolithicus]